MAGSGGLAQQVAEKLADLIQVKPDKIHGFFTPSQFSSYLMALDVVKYFCVILESNSLQLP